MLRQLSKNTERRRRPPFSPFHTPYTAHMPPFPEIRLGGDSGHTSDEIDTTRPASNLLVGPWQGSKGSGPKKRVIWLGNFFC